MSYSKQMLEALSNSDLAGAQVFFEKAKKEDLPEERLQLADNLFQLGFLEESQSLFEQLLEEFKDDALRISLAEIAIENDELEKAFEWLEQIEESSDVYPQSLVTQADIYQMLGIPEVSEQKIKAAKAFMPDEPLLDLSLAELYFASENYKQAIESYQGLQKQYPTFDSPVSLTERIGVALSRIGEFEEAITYLETSVEEEETVERLFQLALTFYQIGENQRAIDLLKQVHLMDEEFNQVHYPLGQILFDEGEFEEALDVAEAGISANPYEVMLYHLASAAAYSSNLKEEAKGYLEEVISLEVEVDFSKIKLAELLLKEEAYEEVIDLLTHLENPDQGLAYWYLAQAYYGEEMFDKASDFYDKAKDYLLDDAEFIRDFGLFLREEGRKEEAMSLLARYLEMVPGDMEIVSLVEE